MAQDVEQQGQADGAAPEDAHQLFVYGTLKPEAAACGGRPAQVLGRLWTGGFPGIDNLAEEGEGLERYQVAGYVWTVSTAKLARLDRYESTAHGFYDRVRTRTVGGEEVWIYRGRGCLAGMHQFLPMPEYAAVADPACRLVDWPAGGRAGRSYLSRQQDEEEAAGHLVGQQ